MKKLFLLLLITQTIVLSQDNFQPYAKLSGSWVLDKSFSDEFNKPKLDETKWWDFNDYEDRIKNPSMFSSPRMVKIGVRVNF